MRSSTGRGSPCEETPAEASTPASTTASAWAPAGQPGRDRLGDGIGHQLGAGPGIGRRGLRPALPARGPGQAPTDPASRRPARRSRSCGPAAPGPAAPARPAAAHCPAPGSSLRSPAVPGDTPVARAVACRACSSSMTCRLAVDDVARVGGVALQLRAQPVVVGAKPSAPPGAARGSASRSRRAWPPSAASRPSRPRPARRSPPRCRPRAPGPCRRPCRATRPPRPAAPPQHLRTAAAGAAARHRHRPDRGPGAGRCGRSSQSPRRSGFGHRHAQPPARGARAGRRKPERGDTACTGKRLDGPGEAREPGSVPARPASPVRILRCRTRGLEDERREARAPPGLDEGQIRERNDWPPARIS